MGQGASVVMTAPKIQGSDGSNTTSSIQIIQPSQAAIQSTDQPQQSAASTMGGGGAPEAPTKSSVESGKIDSLNRLLEALDQTIDACRLSGTDSVYINDVVRVFNDKKTRIEKMLVSNQLQNPHLLEQNITVLESFQSLIDKKQTNISSKGLTADKQALCASIFKSLLSALTDVLTHLSITPVKLTTPSLSYTEYQEQQRILEQQQALKKYTEFRAFLEFIKHKGVSGHHKVPSCFICYAWPAEAHPEEYWVQPFLKQFRKDLMAAGIEVKLDIKSIGYGGDGSQYMKGGIQKSDFVLLIGSESMLLKSQKGLKHVVNTELTLVTEKVSECKAKPSPYNTPVIPLLLSGTMRTAFPPAFRGMSTVKRSFESQGYLKVIKSLLLHLYVMKGQAEVKVQWKTLKCTINTDPKLLALFEPSKASILLGYSKALRAGNTQSLRDYLRDCGEDPDMSFEGGDFQEINLTGGDISGFNFKNAKLNLANLTSVKMSGTELEGAGLSRCIGLKAERHAQARLPHFDSSVTVQPHAYPGDGGGGGAKEDEPIVSSKHLTQTLKQAYSRHNGITVPFEDGVIPFDENYVDLQFQVKFSKEDLGTPATPFKFHDLGSLRRCWIEGAAGSGNTTLARKILYTWATEDDFLSQYQAMLYLPLGKILNLYEIRTALYRYRDFFDLEVVTKWQQFALLNATLEIDEGAISNLMTLLQSDHGILPKDNPKKVLFLIDDLSEIDINHPLLQGLLLKPVSNHDFFIITRPMKIPAWLTNGNHLDRVIINQGFENTSQDAYITKYYQRLSQFSNDDIDPQKKSLEAWVKNQRQAHKDAFIFNPLNLHLICMISSDTTETLPSTPTSSALYNQIMALRIKRALAECKSMYQACGITGATESLRRASIEWKYSDRNKLFEGCARWIELLEAIAFECIQQDDSMTISGKQFVDMINKNEPQLTTKKNIEKRIREILAIGILSDHGTNVHKHTSTYIFPHQTLAEYMAGRYVARHFTRNSAQQDFTELDIGTGGSAEVDDQADKNIHALLFDPNQGFGFFQPKVALVLRFASGTLDHMVKQGKHKPEILHHWVSQLTRAYFKSFWGSGPLLHIFGCLLEIHQSWPTVSNQATGNPASQNQKHKATKFGGGGGSKAEPDVQETAENRPAPIQAIKVIMMTMLWGYVQAHITLGDHAPFDDTISKLWHTGFLQIGSLKDFKQLEQTIQEDARQTGNKVLRKQANDALKLMGMHKVSDSANVDGTASVESADTSHQLRISPDQPPVTEQAETLISILNSLIDFETLCTANPKQVNQKLSEIIALIPEDASDCKKILKSGANLFALVIAYTSRFIKSNPDQEEAVKAQVNQILQKMDYDIVASDLRKMLTPHEAHSPRKSGLLKDMPTSGQEVAQQDSSSFLMNFNLFMDGFIEQSMDNPRDYIKHIAKTKGLRISQNMENDLVESITYRLGFFKKMLIELLMDLHFDASLVPKIIIEFFMGWDLPLLISGNSHNQYQRIGQSPKTLPYAYRYHAAIDDLKPTVIRQGNRCIAHLLWNSYGTRLNESYHGFFDKGIIIDKDYCAISLFTTNGHDKNNQQFCVLEKLSNENTVTIHLVTLETNSPPKIELKQITKNKELMKLMKKKLTHRSNSLSIGQYYQMYDCILNFQEKVRVKGCRLQGQWVEEIISNAGYDIRDQSKRITDKCLKPKLDTVFRNIDGTRQLESRAAREIGGGPKARRDKQETQERQETPGDGVEEKVKSKIEMSTELAQPPVPIDTSRVSHAQCQSGLFSISSNRQALNGSLTELAEREHAEQEERLDGGGQIVALEQEGVTDQGEQDRDEDTQWFAASKPVERCEDTCCHIS